MAEEQITPEEFEKKWHWKRVRPKGLHWILPKKDYIVTACLLDHMSLAGTKENIFAIQDVLYFTNQDKHWFTIHVAPEDLHWIDKDFEIVE